MFVKYVWYAGFFFVNEIYLMIYKSRYLLNKFNLPCPIFDILIRAARCLSFRKRQIY